MAHFIVTLHDNRSGRDAYFNADLPLVKDPTVAKYVLDAELAGCEFEITEVDAVFCVPLKAEINLECLLEGMAEC